MMSTIHECLSQLPKDMVLVNLASVRRSDSRKTAQEWLEIVRDEPGYELRECPVNYGKDIRVSVGIIGGPNLFNQV